MAVETRGIRHVHLLVLDHTRSIAFYGDAFVFSPVVDSLLPFRPDNVTSFFIRVRNDVGAPNVRLHDLRHFTVITPPVLA